MSLNKTYDARLEAVGTEAQIECYKAYCEHGTGGSAAVALNKTRGSVNKSLRSLEKKAVSAGLIVACDEDGVAGAGRIVKKVTTHIKDGEVKQQWIRTDTEAEDVIAKVKDAVEILSQEIVGRSGIGPAEFHGTDGLLSLYPITDLHVGMMAWGKETGEDQDLQIVEQLATETAIRVIRSQPNSKRAIVAFMGDYFHSDDDDNVTSRSGNSLDCDGRIDKTFGVGIRLAKKIIEQVAAKHSDVLVIILPGNHDEYLSMALKHVMMAYYSDSDRVTVMNTHGVFGYVEFGATLLAFHHGHTAKPDRMFQVVANDQREAWGRVKLCHVITGHVHHQSCIDVGMCKIESFRTMCAKDAYAAAGGWRSPRTLYGITYDIDGGEIGRTQQNILPPSVN